MVPIIAIIQTIHHIKNFEVQSPREIKGFRVYWSQLRAFSIETPKKLTVFKGFSVYNLGSNAMVPLTIDMGVHFKNERLFNELHGRIKKSEKELSTIIPKIEQIISYMKSYKGKLNEEKRKKFKEIYEIYQKKNQNHQSMTKKYEELKTLRFNTEKVNLVVKGSAFPEAIIKYRRQTEKISKTQSSFMMSFFPGQEHAPMTAINVKRR